LPIQAQSRGVLPERLELATSSVNLAYLFHKHFEILEFARQQYIPRPNPLEIFERSIGIFSCPVVIEINVHLIFMRNEERRTTTLCLTFSGSPMDTLTEALLDESEEKNPRLFSWPLCIPKFLPDGTDFVEIRNPFESVKYERKSSCQTESGR
jgi:hypothetical protein